MSTMGDPRASQAAGRDDHHALVGRAGIVGAGTLTSRLLGLGREQVLAGMFTRAQTDAFIIAFMIPNLLRQVLAEGAMQTGVLPVLAATRERHGDEAARDLFRRLRALSFLGLLVACGLGTWLAPELVHLAAAGFDAQPGQLEHTVGLARWVFPYLFFVGTAALGLTALNTYQRYVVTSFAPALLNVAFIACGLCLPAALALRGHDRTLALVAGVWLGGLLQVMAQWPSLRAIDMNRRPLLDLSHPGVREVLKRLAPALLGIGVYYVDVFVARRMLSHLDLGATSYFTFALRLCDFPQGIFVMALQAATLPKLSRLAARGDLSELGSTLGFGLKLALFAAIPATLLLVTLAEPLVVLIFQRGEFGPVAATQTARALVAQGLAIWMVAVVRQLLSGFYAMGDTRTPAAVAAIDLAVFAALALLLRDRLGHVGIGLAVTGARLVQMLLLWNRLSRRAGGLPTRAVLLSGMKTTLVSLPAAGAAFWLAGRLSHAGAGPWERLVPGLVGSAAFAVIFFAGAGALRHPELLTLSAGLRRRRSK